MDALKNNWFVLVALVGAYLIFRPPTPPPAEGTEPSMGFFDQALSWATGGPDYTYMTLAHCFNGDQQWMNLFLLGVGLVSLSYIMIIRQFMAVRKIMLDTPADQLQERDAMDEDAFEAYRKSVIEAIEGLIVIFGLCLVLGYSFYLIEVQVPIKRVHTLAMFAHAAWCFRYVHKNHLPLFMNALRVGLHRG